MLTLIHGEDIVSSRKKLEEEKIRLGDIEIIRLDGAKASLSDLVLACQTRSLWSEKKLVIIENLLFGGLSKNKQELLSYLGRLDKQIQVIIWEGKEADKSTIRKYFPRAKEILCKPPQLIFRFLDFLGSASSQQILSLFHACLQQREAELIFSLLLRRFHFLVITADLGKKGLADLNPWQADKLMHQARYFTADKLILSYRKLIFLEYQLKSGQTPYTLSELLDIFLVTL